MEEEHHQVKQNEEEEEEEEASNSIIFNSAPTMEHPLQSFTSMLEDETNILYLLTESLQTHQESFSSLLSTNPFGLSFDLGLDPFPLTAQNLSDFNPNPQFQTTHLPETTFHAFENPQFVSLTKVLKPLELNPSVGAQPTLFQKRVANKSDTFERKRWKGNDDDEGVYDESFDGFCLNCDSDENVKSMEDFGDGDEKGKRKKKKGGPAKNLMAERRRRKKLNDWLYMLRSVVSKISKMDKASILGDAVEYLKELLQKVNDLHTELELTTPSSSILPTDASSFHPLTPTPPTLPCRVKEELCLSPCSLPSPNGERARVEVRMTESRSVNIHMFCARRPGLLLSTLTALDALGLDIQQAVTSCFNGFALDVFEAVQCNDDACAVPEEIRSVLLNTAGYHGAGEQVEEGIFQEPSYLEIRLLSTTQSR